MIEAKIYGNELDIWKTVCITIENSNRLPVISGLMVSPEVNILFLQLRIVNKPAMFSPSISDKNI